MNDGEWIRSMPHEVVAAMQKHSHAKARAAAAATELTANRNELEAAEQGAKIVQEVGSAIQSRVHSHLAGLVNHCLKAVFGPGVEMVLEFTKRRGKAEVDIMFTSDGEAVDPREGEAGGVLDVAAFGFRLAAMLLEKPARRRLLVLDEPFRFLGRKHKPAMAQLLEELPKRLGVQVILVTHDEEFMVGKVVKVGK